MDLMTDSTTDLTDQRKVYDLSASNGYINNGTINCNFTPNNGTLYVTLSTAIFTNEYLKYNTSGPVPV